MNVNLLEHCSMAGFVMYRLYEYRGKSERECRRAYLTGWLHDCMKPFENPDLRNHKELIGEFCSGEMQNALLRHEELLEDGMEYDELHIALILADSMVDGMGDVVGFDKRLEDVKRRYPADSMAVLDTKNNIDWLRRNGYDDIEKYILRTWNIRVTEHDYTYKKVEE